MSYEYTFLTTEEIPSYIASRPELAKRVDADHLVRVEEVGDGNLNLVFLVEDANGSGLAIKQALPYVRMTGEGWPMTPERSRFEVQSLQAHGALEPELVVEVIDRDDDRYIFTMEDLSDHRVWRGALIDGQRHEGAAEAVGRYIGAVAFGTSLFGMEREALAAAQAASVNPQLCTITEDLVFTEPVCGADRNSVLPGNEPDMADFQADPVMKQAMGEAKWIFMTHAEALLHGDLHTGSVMVRGDKGEAESVKVFDSEFAFYGPVAFDMGAIWANYVIAAARAFALGQDELAEWELGLLAKTWDAFAAEFRRRWPTRVDPRLWDDAFVAAQLDRWLSETWLFAAAKMSRRIIGAAKTKDIESLEPALREGAARGVLLTSREMVRRRGSSPAQLAELAAELLAGARTRG